MGSEGAGLWLGIPVVLTMVVVLAILVRFVGQDASSEANPDDASDAGPEDTSTRTLGLGRNRIATGYLTVLFASAPIAAWLNRDDPSMIILSVLISVALMVLVMTVLGLPILWLLSMVRLVSWAGLACAGAVVGLLLGYWFDGSMVVSTIIGMLLAAAFSLGAQLPGVRSMPANISLQADRER